MRVHIIGINYWPEKTGIALLTTGRAEYLAARGHQVTMCTAVPYYPQWQVAAEYRRRPFARETRAGVDIRRCPIYVPSVVTTVRRAVHELSFVVASFVRSVTCRRPDVILVVSPPLGLALTAIVLSRLWRVPYIFDVEDLQPDAALDLGMIRGGRIARLLYAVERLAYRHAAAVSTLTEAMRARIAAKGVPPEQVLLLPAWADPELFDLAPRPDDRALREELGLGDAFVVLHAGNMGVKQGLDVVLAAAEQAESPGDIVYVLVGDGAMRARLESSVAARRLSSVRLVPLLPRDRFLRLLAAADVCLVTQQRTVADIVFPSKVVTLLAAGKPVVASVNERSEVARVIAESGAGTVLAPEDPAALSLAVRRLKNDPALRGHMSAAGRAYAHRLWERERTLDRMSHVLERHAAGSRPVEVWPPKGSRAE